MDPRNEENRSPFSEEEAIEMTRVAEVALEREVRELREQNQRLSDRLEQFRAHNLSADRELVRVRAELEVCQNNLQELNLLDAFLRSGAVRTLDLSSDPGLKDLLTMFLGRALQTALDTRAVQFPNPRRSETG